MPPSANCFGTPDLIAPFKTYWCWTPTPQCSIVSIQGLPWTWLAPAYQFLPRQHGVNPVLRTAIASCKCQFNLSPLLKYHPTMDFSRGKLKSHHKETNQTIQVSLSPDFLKPKWCSLPGNMSTEKGITALWVQEDKQQWMNGFGWTKWICPTWLCCQQKQFRQLLTRSHSQFSRDLPRRHCRIGETFKMN